MIIPFYTELDQSRTGSIFNIARSLLLKSIERGDVRLLIYQPSGAGCLSVDEYWDIKNVAIDYLPYKNDFATRMPLGYVNDDFKKIKRRNDYYVLLNTRTTASMALQKVSSKPGFAGFFPEVINYFNAGDFNEVTMRLHPSTIRECLLSLSMYWNILHNKAWLLRVTSVLSKVYTPSIVRSFKAKSIAIPLGIETSKIDEVKAFPKENGVFTLIYGGRPATHKGVDRMIRVCSYLHAEGMPIKLKLFLLTASTNSVGDKIEELKKYPFTEVRVNAPIREFYAHAKSADAFLAPSTAEAYGIAYVEMLYAGATGIFYQRPWIAGILPPDYKWVCNGDKEAVIMCKVLANRKKKVRSIDKEYIQKFHNRDVHVDKVLTLAKALSMSIKEKLKLDSWQKVIDHYSLKI